jgi:hypothetical protein
VELSEYDQWWKHQGGQKLRRLLMKHWDPIGVKNAPEAADEYDGYRAGVMQLLRSGASGESIAAHLSRVEQEGLGFRTTPKQLRPVGERIVRWYADSLTRGDGAHPGR